MSRTYEHIPDPPSDLLRAEARGTAAHRPDGRGCVRGRRVGIERHPPLAPARWRMLARGTVR